jgi:hypothetical protein
LGILAGFKLKREKDLWGFVHSLPGSDILANARLTSLIAFGLKHLKNLVGRIPLFLRQSLILLHQRIDTRKERAKDRSRLAPRAPTGSRRVLGNDPINRIAAVPLLNRDVTHAFVVNAVM